MTLVTKTSVAEVWRAVCDGANTAPLVSDRVGVSRGHAAVYLRVMTEVGLLTRDLDALSGVRQNQHTLTYVYAPNYDAARALGW
jgi:hypothetical protein